MTCRWPGYAAKVTVLKEMGLLSQEPVDVDGVPVVPKKLLDALLKLLERCIKHILSQNEVRFARMGDVAKNLS